MLPGSVQPSVADFEPPRQAKGPEPPLTHTSVSGTRAVPRRLCLRRRTPPARRPSGPAPANPRRSVHGKGCRRIATLLLPGRPDSGWLECDSARTLPLDALHRRPTEAGSTDPRAGRSGSKPSARRRTGDRSRSARGLWRMAYMYTFPATWIGVGDHTPTGRRPEHPGSCGSGRVGTTCTPPDRGNPAPAARPLCTGGRMEQFPEQASANWINATFIYTLGAVAVL